MNRLLAALLALLFLLPAVVQAEPRLRHAAAAKPAVCRPGSVQLNSGLCCPRSGLTRGGGCVSGSIRPGVVPPPLAYCYGGASRDALGRCPATSCTPGYSRDRFGQCQRSVACANGRAPNPLGRCPPVIAITPRPSLNRACPGGGFAGADGNCPPLFLCKNGYAPVAGRCGISPTLPAAIVSPVLTPAPARQAPLIRPHIAAPQIHTPPALARPQLVVPLASPAPIAHPVAPPAPVISPRAPLTPPPALAAPRKP